MLVPICMKASESSAHFDLLWLSNGAVLSLQRASRELKVVVFCSILPVRGGSSVRDWNCGGAELWALERSSVEGTFMAGDDGRMRWAAVAALAPERCARGHTASAIRLRAGRVFL